MSFLLGLDTEFHARQSPVGMKFQVDTSYSLRVMLRTKMPGRRRHENFQRAIIQKL